MSIAEKLVKIASDLDQCGKYKESDQVTQCIYRLSTAFNTDDFIENQNPTEIPDIQEYLNSGDIDQGFDFDRFKAYIQTAEEILSAKTEGDVYNLSDGLGLQRILDMYINGRTEEEVADEVLNALDEKSEDARWQSIYEKSPWI